MTKYHVLFWMTVFCLVACQNGQEKSIQGQELPSSDIVPEQVAPSNIFVSVIGGLRVREEPNAQSKVIGNLAYGEEVLYLGKESEQKERIELRDKMRFVSWKKIKMYEGTSNEVEGWVYGGGLLNFDVVYREISLNTIERKIISANASELSRILDLKVSRDFFYNGTVGYVKSDSGKLIKDGSFKVKGMAIQEIDGYDYDFISRISGNYKLGKADGIFKKSESVYESGDEVTIKFENGKCVWKSITYSSEGEKETTREDNPSDCGF